MNNLVFCDKFENNIIEILKEQQIKIGYREESVGLYYPLQSLKHFFEGINTAQEMYEVLCKYFNHENRKLVGVQISYKKDRFCFQIPSSGVKYVHDNANKDDFLCEFIHACGSHDCSIEKIHTIFTKYSDQVHFQKVDGTEFDYLLYFENGNPDDYRYCITMEERHVIYHRFTPEDYEDFDFGM